MPAKPAADSDGQADPEAIAKAICLRLLTAAPRTRAQLADALRRRNVPQDAADAVLSRFAEAKLIDDALFASTWVESRHHGRGLARRALASELRRRGVGTEHISAAVGALGPDEELAMARALVSRRLASVEGRPPAVQARQLAGMLARKGYPPALCYRVVREALERRGTDPVAAGLSADEPFEVEPESPAD